MRQNIRIVSLVPSLTETLCDFGLQESVVGCTNYCISPKNLRKTSTSIGGTKDPDIQKIISLSPTHILINEEENTAQIRKEIKENLKFKNTHIIESFPKNAEDAISLVTELGNIFKCNHFAQEWSQKAYSFLEEAKKEGNLKIAYVYFIWRKPWMVAGNKTYISAMLDIIGFQNQVITKEDLASRYPAIQESDPILKNSQILLFSSEPYPFKKRHVEEFLQISNLKQVQNLMVDGQNLSWYGTRTLKGLTYLLSLKKQASRLLF
jgi:iron complex transport system substrate-binding protein